METHPSRRRFIALAVAGVAGAGGIALLTRARNVDPIAFRARADAIGRQHGIYIGYEGPKRSSSLRGHRATLSSPTVH
jgi:hypothetical protein